ncbi:hypothetical protein [Desulfuromonas thiophila]|uniref:hypothetical protein n=1 Tax=Desulfuromonas thiophila TaxID=57664 RepID=UPI0024AA004E|nr:hypothetical protein [Desulfuromonas thiophila]
MKIICNLYAQWISSIRAELTKEGFDHTSLGDQDCAITWQSWKRRIVSPARRTLHKAPAFNCPNHLQSGLTDLETAFTNGADIWPWQSKLIDRLPYEDGLYNDYRVLHFHLGTGREASGYINRTDELLFAIVDRADVYEIGIYRHGDWHELDILDIIDNAWPAFLDRVTIRALDVSNCPQTREEVKALRQAHVVSIVKLKSGRIVAPPGGGVATDGTSIEAVTSADYWAKLLRNGEKAIIASIQEQVQKGMMESKDYDVVLEATDNEIAGTIAGAAKWILWKRT